MFGLAEPNIRPNLNAQAWPNPNIRCTTNTDTLDVFFLLDIDHEERIMHENSVAQSKSLKNLNHQIKTLPQNLN